MSSPEYAAADKNGGITSFYVVTLLFASIHNKETMLGQMPQSDHT